MQTRRIVEIGALLVILAVAAFLRWTGLAWDNGYLFHPDERQIVLVVSNLQFPSNPVSLLTPESSLNPRFFAYGSFPLYLLRALVPLAPATTVIGPWADEQLARWLLLGRAVSGLFDLGTIVVTYALGRRLYGAWVGVVAAAAVAVTVLHIQLSHFYAVDTIVTFFTIATLYAALRVSETSLPHSIQKHYPNLLWIFLCGIGFGLALATKITAFGLVIPILVACLRLTNAPPLKFSRQRARETWRVLRRPFLYIVGIALVTFIVTQPYAVIDWYQFGSDVSRELLVARGWLDYPYTRQFAGTVPFVYQVMQVSVWGMGIPLAMFAWGGAALFLYQWVKGRDWRDTFLLSFALVYFVTFGLQYAKYLRYLLPLLPVLYILATCALARAFSSRRGVLTGLVGIVLAVLLLYALAFVQIYSREHPWLTASRWIYEHVPPSSALIVEEWDDTLPTMLRTPSGERRPDQYSQIQLPLYDEDTDAKRAALASALANADYVMLASHRVYSSIGRLQSRYPMTNRYYEKLFNGELGFEPVETERNDPELWGVTIRDDPFSGLAYDAGAVDALLKGDGTRVWNWGFADESFTVYDHPQPIVFQKVRDLTKAEIEARLRE